MRKRWFVKGATRGFSAEIVKAAIGSGDLVIATARKRFTVIVDFRNLG
jgi:hypothetical protein